MEADESVLGYVRLSRATPDSTSVERQRELIERWLGDRTLVHVAEDVDVSGAESPWKRDGLGPWLTEPDKLAQWDVLVAWKLDRVSRSALDTLQLLEHADEHGKRIVAIDDSLDSASQMGRVWIQLSAIFAAVERTNLRERILASKRHQRANAKWSVGRAPYGFRTVPAPDGTGKVLEHDPHQVDVIQDIVRRFLRGDSYGGIATVLNNAGEPSPRAGETRKDGGHNTWSVSTIRDMLASEALRGRVRYKGAVVRGADGLPLQYAEPLVDTTTWDAIQTEAKRRAPFEGRAERSGRVSFMLGIGYCQCGAPLTAGQTSAGARRYVCTASRRPGADKCRIVTSVLADRLDAWTEAEFLRLFGHMRMIYEETIPGVDHSADIRELQASVKRLDDAFAGGAFEADTDTYVSMRRGMQNHVAQLEAEPVTEARTVTHESDETFSDVWEASTLQQKRQMILDFGFTVTVGPARGKGPQADVEGRFSAGPADWVVFGGTDEMWEGKREAYEAAQKRT